MIKLTVEHVAEVLYTAQILPINNAYLSSWSSLGKPQRDSIIIKVSTHMSKPPVDIGAALAAGSYEEADIDDIKLFISIVEGLRQFVKTPVQLEYVYSNSSKPKKFEFGKLYAWAENALVEDNKLISRENHKVHLCPCGCGQKLTLNDAKKSYEPWNTKLVYENACGSKYYIEYLGNGLVTYL